MEQEESAKQNEATEIMETAEKIEPAKEMETDQEIEPAEQMKTTQEPAEQNETAVKIEPIDQKSPNRLVVTPSNEDLRPTGPNGKLMSKQKWKKWKKLSNLLKRKSTTEIESTERMKPVIEPPEAWNPSRLRQNARELVLNRIKAEAQDELSLKLERKRERQAKKRAKQQNNFVEFISVKVEEEQSQIDMGVKNEDCRHIGNGRGYHRPRNKARPAETEEQRSVRLERKRKAALMRHKNETEEQRSVRLERLRIADLRRRENETQEQRSVRLERLRMAKLKRRENETEKERLIRLQRQRIYWRMKNWKATQVQQEIVEEGGQQVDTGDYIEGSEESSAVTLNTEVGDLGSEYAHYEEFSTESQNILIKEEIIEEDHTVDTGDYIEGGEESSAAEFEVVFVKQEVIEDQDVDEVGTGDHIEGGNYFTIVHKGDEESSVGTFNIEIANLIPEHSLHEEISTESATPTQFSQQNCFPELSLVKVEEEQQEVDMAVTVNDCRRTRIKRGPYRKRKKTRPAETAEQRLERYRIASARRLANETEEQRITRLARRQMRRDAETEEERLARLKRARERETEEQRLLRLARSRAAIARRLANETKEQKLARLERERMAYMLRRVAETEEERLARVERARIVRLRQREAETEEERRVRLELQVKRRQTETAEQRAKRLESYRRWYLKNKSLRMAKRS